MTADPSHKPAQLSVDPEVSLSKSWSLGNLRPWLQLLARRQTTAGADASDVVQQTLLQAWQNESNANFHSTAERLAWFRIILTNTIRKQHRAASANKRGGTIRHESIDENKHIPMSQQVAVKTNPVISGEESLRLAEAIEKLPNDQRHVITRQQFDGVEYETIAAELNRSVEATRMLRVRVLRTLRTLLE